MDHKNIVKNVEVSIVLPMLILYLSEQLRVGTWLEDDETAVRDGDLFIWLLELLSTGSDRCLQLWSKPFDQSRLRT